MWGKHESHFSGQRPVLNPCTHLSGRSLLTLPACPLLLQLKAKKGLTQIEIEDEVTSGAGQEGCIRSHTATPPETLNP